MRKVLWIIFQVAVVGTVLLLDWVMARATNEPTQPQLAFVVGMLFAAGLTALILRFSDGMRFGWKASAPPAISRADKIEGNVILLRWFTYVAAGVLAFIGIFGTSDMEYPRASCAVLVAAATALLIVSYLLRTWMLSRIGSLPGDVDPNQVAGAGPIVGGGNVRQPQEIGRRGEAAGRGFRQMPKPLGRLGSGKQS